MGKKNLPQTAFKNLDYPVYLFHQGSNCRAYELLGCHYGPDKTVFRVWAPNAQSVSVAGDFNAWSITAHPMVRLNAQGVWQAEITGVSLYDAYKYAVKTQKGEFVLKADPYGFHMETRPGTASKVYYLGGYAWGDGVWQRKKKALKAYDYPLNIYELHAGSWRQYPDGEYFGYGKLADELIPYVKELGYTHVELMPLSEYPLDDSWGYQVMGYFALTSRYGTPQEFMAFVDQFHRAGLGVIMDFVPAHFPKDAAGLYEFDGGFCYEYANPLKREHPDWGTRVFDFGRGEVKSFLTSAAAFWADYFHIDGIRVDAVASMLYLDYGREDGSWQPNANGGKECLEAIQFLRDLNTAMHREHPGTLMIAEESTAWPRVTRPVEDGGLGFDLKWNLGWMHDTLGYMSTDPYFRAGNHNAMTFSTSYAHSENYLLTLSHDEVVHGKHSLLNKMFGSYEEKFASLRAYYAFMMSHPGKKLMFMGGEFGQFIEWNFRQGLDWMLLDYQAHREMLLFTKTLNALYLAERAFWDGDYSPEGFRWVVADDTGQNVYAFKRIDKTGREVLCVFNFAARPYQNYRIGMPSGVYQEMLSTDEKRFGGGGACNARVKTQECPMHGEETSLVLTLPRLSAIFLKRVANMPRKKKPLDDG